MRPRHHHVHLQAGVREDLAWWSQHLEWLNGDPRAPIVCMSREHQLAHIYLDARGGSGGIGIFVDGGFVGLTGSECNALFPAGSVVPSPGVGPVPRTDANSWELFAFCALMLLFHDYLAGRYVRVDSDSATAVKCIRCLSANLDSPELAGLTRSFLSLTVRYHVRVEPRHIPGVRNVLADALSRGQWRDFGRRADGWCAEVGRGHSPFLRSLGEL